MAGRVNYDPKQPFSVYLAALIAERFPETVEGHPELVAHHFAEAG